MEGLFFIIFTISMIALTFCTGAIYALIKKKIEAKRRKKHPQLWKWFEECNEKGFESARWYNMHIAPAKRSIDVILREWDYYPIEIRIQKEADLEVLRQSINSAMSVYVGMNTNIESLREKIRKYVKEHDLQWARDMGW